MLRDCFSGKNKTLRSLFLKKSAVRRMLLRRKSVLDGCQDAPGGAKRTHATSGRRSGVSEEEVLETRGEVEQALAKAGLTDYRPNAMPLESFLDLFHCTTEAGMAWHGRVV